MELIIFPTRYLVRQHRDECMMKQINGVSYINAMTFDDLVDRCMPSVKGMTYIDDICRRAVIDAIVRHYADEAVYFREALPGYIWAIAQDIGELKMAGITPEEFKRLWLADAGGDARWAQDLYSFYSRYEELLCRHKLYDKEDRYIMAAEVVSKGAPPFLNGVERLEFKHFFDLTPLQRNIIEALDRYADCVIEGGVVDEAAAMEHVIALGCSNVGITAAWDRRVECLWIVRRIKKLLESGYDFADICIIARDAAAYEEPLRWAFKHEGLEVPRAGYAALSDNAMISHIIKWISDFAEEAADAGDAVNSPYLKPLMGLDASLPQRDTAAGYAQVLLNVLERSELIPSIVEYGRMGYIEQMADDLKVYEQFIHILQSITAAQQWSGNAKTMEATEFVRLLEDMCRRCAYYQDMSPGKSIMVLTPSAARGLKFAAVFMAGMIEGQFPRAIRPDWLIKDEDRLKAGNRMMTSLSLLKQERIFFNCAVQVAQRELFFTYPNMDADGNPVLLSSFVEDVKTALPGIAVVDVGIGDVLSSTGRAFAPEVPAASSLPDDAPQYAAQRFEGSVFSATAFNEYGTCPYKFFLGRVLRLKPAAEEEAGPSALDIGAIYHAALKKFMQPYIGQQLIPAQREEYRQRMADVAAQLIDASNLKDGYDCAALYEIEKQRMIEALLQWLDAELALQQSYKVEYRPMLLEWPFGMDGNPPLVLERNHQAIRLQGRIDRVDAAPDGRLLIYDYKKGKSTSSIDDVLKGTDFQLPIYICAARSLLSGGGFTPVGAVYYCVEGAGLGGILVKQDSGVKTSKRSKNVKGVLDDEQWEEVLAQTVDKLYEYYNAILQGVYPKEPKKCPLQDAYGGGFCDFTDICRAGERG